VTQPEIVVVELASFGRTAALRIARSIQAAVRERGSCALALPAGPQTHLVYEHLRELQLPWSDVDFYFSEERCVPPRHPASAYSIAADLLFTVPRIGHDGVQRIEAERPDHAALAADYDAILPERLDLAIFELGLDGHIAGLFPHASALDERERRVLAVESPQKPHQRITLAPRAIEEARDVVVLAIGRERAAIARKALCEDGAVHDLPARLVLRGTWILDRTAAALLER
jgi:6-phosphogluconolactonase